MTNVTKNDLTAKSMSQLAALFQEASRGLMAATANLAAKQSRLEAIRAEIARRRPSR